MLFDKNREALVALRNALNDALDKNPEYPQDMDVWLNYIDNSGVDKTRLICALLDTPSIDEEEVVNHISNDTLDDWAMSHDYVDGNQSIDELVQHKPHQEQTQWVKEFIEVNL